MSRKEDNNLTPGATRSAQAGSRVASNTLWNIFGAGLPFLLALVTFPLLIDSIGKERFGVLAIAWVVLGYFGLFDLGLGRATTKFLAEAFERNRAAEVRALLWTSLSLNLILGVIGGCVLAALSPLLVGETLNVDASLRSESLAAFYLMAATVPLVTLTSAVRGVLEAQHSFRLLNVLQIPISALTYLAPLMVLPFSKSLPWLIGALAISRLLGMVVFAVATLRNIDGPFAGPFFARKRLRELFTYGGWLTVTNVIGPLMVYADRIVIGSLLSMTAVTYYATPYEAATRLGILPQSVARTVFPIFAAGGGAEREASVYRNAVKFLALTLAPVVATAVVFGPDLLSLWIGEAFARNSTLVLQILAVGVLMNALALIPFTLIQGVGRPDVTAKLHLLETPFYLLFLLYAIKNFGIVGAAVVWTARVSVDGLLLAFYVRTTGLVSPPSGNLRLHGSLTLAALLVCCGWLLSALSGAVALKMSVWALLLAVASYAAWRNLLASDEREKSKAILRTTVAKLDLRRDNYRSGEDQEADR